MHSHRALRGHLGLYSVYVKVIYIYIYRLYLAYIGFCRVDTDYRKACRVLRGEAARHVAKRYVVLYTTRSIRDQ